MFRRFFRWKSTASPAPARPPRLKTYTAESGHVFHYFSHGRPLTASDFVFEVTQDYRSWQPLTVLLPDQVLLEWQQTHARELSSTERYALAKMKFFQFLETHSPSAPLPDVVEIDRVEVPALLEKLDVS